MTCEKHCLHWEVCRLTPPEYATAKYYTFCNCAEKCECFKDKSDLISYSECSKRIKEYFKTVIDSGEYIVEATDANSDIQRILKEVAE